MSNQTLAPYKAEFLKAAIGGGVLKFGSFELKSKRVSPYFFNAGDFYRADLLRAISTAYARAVIEAREQKVLGEFDVVFGPAYKGIPLATATTDKLAELDPARYSQVCYSFDRKEAKDHGEGGNIVGAPLKGKRVLIVDDVITAGTAKREAIAKIRAEGGTVVGIVVALDRMEKLPSPDGDDDKPMPSALGEIKKEYGLPIIAILTLDDIIDGMKSFASEDEIKRTEEYRKKYKATD
ncbi:orotate phosphoribosyltransferase [Magnaporthiopsis poae ATCC 64411]|uniref:Orotate phosphoribosyltransferase n=1 Tax=Magnaporthiopsis poae (strain ATCC 64411 / 73-15) TaxID=644358 RepID=A0A0C4DMC4_MAGP6|nr:orotate phosphoribosyltransferase [Magnaporthiopsis poae ATCC 64411]